MNEELKSTLKYLKNKNNTRRIKTITINEAHKVVEEIERLNNIINKAIEYIQDRYDGEVLTHTFDKCNVGELLEILDKVGSDKE